MNRNPLRRTTPLVALVIAAACHDAASPTAPAVPAPNGPLYAAGAPRVVPTGKGIGTRTYSVGPRTKYRADNHNGQVMLGTTHVYFIWYGTGWGDGSQVAPAVNILTDLILNLGHSSYLNITSLYGDAFNARPSGSLMFGTNIWDSYSRGTTLSDADVEAVVVNAINVGSLPLDPRGVYFVLGSPDVSVSGLAVTWCAFHQRTTVAGVRVAYAFIGSPARDPSQCAPQLSSPNGDMAADAMASLVAAELANAITDPNLDGWYDRLGLEPADKCAWNFGPTYQAPNGAQANVRLGARDYLLQRLWVPEKGNGGYCAMAAPSP